MTNYNCNVDHSNPQDRKLIYKFGREMQLNNKQVGRKSPRSLIKLFQSPAITASGISTIFLPENPNEL